MHPIRPRLGERIFAIADDLVAPLPVAAERAAA
jgi:hypothetical protein